MNVIYVYNRYIGLPIKNYKLLNFKDQAPLPELPKIPEPKKKVEEKKEVKSGSAEAPVLSFGLPSSEE